MTKSNTDRDLGGGRLRTFVGSVRAELLIDGEVVSEVPLESDGAIDFPGYACREVGAGVRPNATVHVVLEDGVSRSFAAMAHSSDG